MDKATAKAQRGEVDRLRKWLVRKEADLLRPPQPSDEKFVDEEFDLSDLSDDEEEEFPMRISDIEHVVSMLYPHANDGSENESKVHLRNAAVDADLENQEKLTSLSSTVAADDDDVLSTDEESDVSDL